MNSSGIHPSQLPYTVVRPSAPSKDMSYPDPPSYSDAVLGPAPLETTNTQSQDAQFCPIAYQPTNYNQLAATDSA